MKKVEESSNKSAYLYAIRLLAKRDYSIHKLTKKLKEREYDSDHVNEAIKEVVKLGYINEELYCEARVKTFMLKGLHPSFIQMKLYEEGLSVEEAMILQVFSEYSMTIHDQVQELLIKKLPKDGSYKGLDYETQLKTKLKAFRYASSKGHEESLIQDIFDQIISIDQ